MAAKENGTIIDNIVNTQKKVLDSIVENTRKFTGNNEKMNENIDKGTDWYKNWLDTQKNLFSKTEDKAAAASENAKETAAQMNEFFQNWFRMQADMAKSFWDKAQDNAKNMVNNATGTNPFAAWQNAGSNNMAGMWGNWMNQASGMNPFNMDAAKKATDTMTGMFQQYYNMLNNGMGDWQKHMQHVSMEDVYKNMINTGSGFAKFAELWTPMFKSIQDKSFNMDMYKQMMNPELYKDMMDKYLGLFPESARTQMQQMGNMMTEGMKQFTQAGMDNYNFLRNGMNQFGNGNHAFESMMNGYNQFSSMMNEAAAPFAKMATPNEYTRAMGKMNEIANQIAAYNMKNADLQYMIYNTGGKVMDALAENVAAKVKDGVEIKSMLGLYQEWLNISDKVFVNLFESDDYSRLMAEVGSMQMKLRKEIEAMMEKSFDNIPVAKRSEIDELTKTVYDLKKQVRQLEKMLEIETDEEIVVPAPKKTSRTTKK